MLSINTNVSSLFAQNSLSDAQNSLAASVQRLSSGLRINSAADDAAGLSISQNLQSQINGVNQSIRCLSDATNLLQVADSSLASIQDMLLKMKQLATQGLDGSLNSNQRLDIANELENLNSEINATAQRAKYNGIAIIASGSSIDNVNSSIKVGARLSNEAISISNLGLGHYAIGGDAGANANLGDSAVTRSGINSTFQIILDPNLSDYTPGVYTLVNSGSNLTISGNFKGQYQSQTIMISDATNGGNSTANNTTNQRLNFSKFGISIDLSTTVAQGASETGAQLAAALVDKGTYASGSQSTIRVSGNGAEISDVRLSGAADGAYQLAKVGKNQIKLIKTTALGQIASETISLNDSAQNAIQTLNFEAMGIAIDVHSFQAQTAEQIASALSALAGGDPVAVISTSGFTSSNQAISLDASDGFVLQIGANSYSTKGTLNGVINTGVGGLSHETTLGDLSSWINNLAKNLDVNVASIITGSGSQYTLDISSKGGNAPRISGILESAVSDNASLVTASADASASSGVNAVNVTTGASKTWSMTVGASSSSVALDPTNGFELSVGGVTYRNLGTGGSISLSDLAGWINGLTNPITHALTGVTATYSGGASPTLTLTSGVGASNFFSVSGIYNQVVGGFSSPSNPIAIGSDGLQLTLGSTTYSSLLSDVPLNQTPDGYSSLSDIVDWINGLNSGVTASILGDANAGFSLALMRVGPSPVNIAIDGIRPSANEANFSSPTDAVTLDPTNGFRIVAGAGGAAIFSTNSIPIVGTRSDGAITLSDLADWVNNLNVGLVASIGGGNGSPFTINVRYAPDNPDLSPITMSGIINGTTTSDVNVALATANAGVTAGIHDLTVTQTAAATSCNIAGFYDSNALVDVSSFRLIVGNGQTYSDGSIGADVYYAYGSVFRDTRVSVALPGQDLGASFGAASRALQDKIDVTHGSFWGATPLYDPYDTSVPAYGKVTVAAFTDWINGLRDRNGNSIGVSAYLFTSSNDENPGARIDTATGLTVSGQTVTGDVQIHIQGLNTGIGNAIGFSGLDNIAISQNALGAGSIVTHYATYDSGTVSLSINGGIDTNYVLAAYLLAGTTDAYQCIDDPRNIIFNGTSYYWQGLPEDVDPNYVNDPSRGLLDTNTGYWVGQASVVKANKVYNPTQPAVLPTYLGQPIHPGFLSEPNPNVSGALNPDGVVNFSRGPDGFDFTRSRFTGDPGMNSVVVARDAKGYVDSTHYFSSSSNQVLDAGGTGINLTLTANIAPSDRPETANIFVDVGISNSPGVLNANQVSINEGANFAGILFQVNGASYQLDSNNQATVGGITYTYHSGQGNANVTVSGALSSTLDFKSDAGKAIQISQKGPSALEFQSGATSNFHITVYTSNVMTESSGSNTGSYQEMVALGNSIRSRGVGSIFGLTASDSVASWQAAFMNLSGLVDKANDRISSQRGAYGAQLNTIGFNISNLQSQSSAMQISKSSILDANFALETSKLAKGQILEQASTAVLAQANQAPSVILGLLDRSFSNNYDIRNFA